MNFKFRKSSPQDPPRFYGRSPNRFWPRGFPQQFFANLVSQKSGRVKQTEFLDPDEILADSLSALGSSLNPEGKMEQSLGRVSSPIFMAIMSLGIIYLFSQAVGLQYSAGEKFFSQSQKNRFLTRTTFPPRGMIYDSQDQPLVENIPVFGLVFQKNAFLNKKGDLKTLLEKLGSGLGQPPEFFFGLGFPEDLATGKLPSQIFISQDLPMEKVVDLSSQLDSLPGLEIFESYRRVYSDPLANSHLLGFVGKISPEDLARRPVLKNEETVGKNGLEAFYDSVIRGSGGKKIVEIDSRGKETRFKLVEKPEEGAALKLTVDKNLQAKAYELINHYTAGNHGASLVALDPRNGEILSLVSFPGFDINALSKGLSEQEYKKISEDPLKPFFNRAISGEFPSGSTFKPLVAAAALQEKIIDPEKQIYDSGSISIPNPFHPGEQSIFVDWKAHGWINFYDAIAVSANVYFYTIGGGYKDQKGLGVERIKKYAEKFGLGSKLGIDLPGEKDGFLPDPENKKFIEPQNPIWRIGDTYNLSIGQGGLKVTPLQMADLTAAIANGGKLYQPHILSSLTENGKTSETKKNWLLKENLVDSDVLAKVRQGMRQAVTSGSAALLNNLNQPVSAKTGTAQPGGNKKPHSWAIAFAPAENPTVAIAVIAENSGEGTTVAIPIVHDFLDWYFVLKSS